jgi:protein subunit release factor B
MRWCQGYAYTTTSNEVVGNCKGKEYLELTDQELMKQCQMDTFKSSGPGGQHRNKRESAVRLKHLPTGIIAQVFFFFFFFFFLNKYILIIK